MLAKNLILKQSNLVRAFYEHWKTANIFTEATLSSELARVDNESAFQTSKTACTSRLRTVR